MKTHRLSRMSSALRPLLATLPALALLSACSSTPKAEEEAQAQASADTKVAQRSLASFSKPASEQACYDRAKEPYTALVDAHFHPRPFGGAAMPAPENPLYTAPL